MTGPRAERQPPDPAPVSESAPEADVPAVRPGREGPPGSGIFTLEGRRAPGLYLIAWILTVAGLAVGLVLGPLASDPTWRPLLIFLGAIATTLGLAAGAGSQVLERADRDPERYRGPAPLLVFTVYFMALSALGIVVINWLGVDPDQPFGFFANVVIQSLGYVLVISLFVVRSGALSWSEMGWPTWHGPAPTDVARAIGWGIVVMVPATFAMLIVGTIVGLALGVDAPRQFPLSETPLDGVFVALSAGLLVPIGEEVFFRGFMLTAWMRDTGPRTALIRSSLFFGLLHLVALVSTDFAQGLREAAMVLAVLLPVGFVFGWIFIRFGLMASIAAHVSYNSLLLALAFLASKIPEPPGV